jgi:transcriptional regulator with XRE-family HTH domain
MPRNNYLILPTYRDIRSARNYIGWSQSEFARKVGLTLGSITKIERNVQIPTKNNLEKIAEVFAGEDLYFLAGGGHKIEKSIVKVFEGEGAIIKVLDDVLKTCSPNKDEVLLWGGDNRRSSPEVIAKNQEIYNAGITFKFLAAKGNNYIYLPLEDYRQIDKSLFLSKDVTVIYKNKILFFADIEGDLENYILTKVKIIIIENKGMADQFRAFFYRLWDKGEKPTHSTTKQLVFKPKKKK